MTPRARAYLRDPECWLLLAGCAAAAGGVGVLIVVPLLFMGLVISGLPGFLTAWPIARRVRGERDWVEIFVRALFANLCVACGVFIAGAAFRLLWG